MSKGLIHLSGLEEDLAGRKERRERRANRRSRRRTRRSNRRANRQERRDRRKDRRAQRRGVHDIPDKGVLGKSRIRPSKALHITGIVRSAAARGSIILLINNNVFKLRERIALAFMLWESFQTSSQTEYRAYANRYGKAKADKQVQFADTFLVLWYNFGGDWRPDDRKGYIKKIKSYVDRVYRGKFNRSMRGLSFAQSSFSPSLGLGEPATGTAAAIAAALPVLTAIIGAMKSSDVKKEDLPEVGEPETEVEPKLLGRIWNKIKDLFSNDEVRQAARQGVEAYGQYRAQQNPEGVRPLENKPSYMQASLFGGGMVGTVLTVGLVGAGVAMAVKGMKGSGKSKNLNGVKNKKTVQASV